jgi:Asp/Glu/hydantoin racemase
MRILFLNQAPKTPKNIKPHYDTGKIESLLNTYASPGTKVEVGFPDDFEGAHILEAIGSQSALNGLHHMMETPAIVRKIFWAAENGYDAVIQSNTFDPGVDGGRLAVNIPVIGLMRTALHFGLTLADRIGVTVPLATHVPYTRRIIRSYGLESFVTGIKPIGVYGKDMAAEKERIFETTVGLIRSLVDDTGAEIVLPLGGAIIPYVVDPADLEKATGVQVLNTKSIGIRFAETCVHLGLTQSALTYPRPKLTYGDFIQRG